MTNDISQTNLNEPAQVDWENFGQSKYQAPPPALDQEGNPITYFGVVKEAKETDPDEGYLNYLLDPIVLVNSPVPNADGYEIRFTRASARPFTKKNPDGSQTPVKGNINKLATFVKAAGTGKPMTNAEYRAHVKAALNKKVPLTLDWEAYNKETGESVRGYYNFPVDPDNPTRRKAILKQGDVLALTDKKGNPTGQTYVVKSEVLFANAKVRYFRDKASK